ncbi:hypothetical protein H8958_013759 [Nasalis larvatus]
MQQELWAHMGAGFEDMSPKMSQLLPWDAASSVLWPGQSHIAPLDPEGSQYIVNQQWAEAPGESECDPAHQEPDNMGHRFGPDAENKKLMIQQMDRTIGYLVGATEKHNLTEHLNVIITGHHGMTTVKQRPDVNEIPLSLYIKFRDLVKVDIVDYGGFGIPLTKLGQEEEALHQALKNAHSHLQVYKKEEFPEHFHLAKHDRVLPIVQYANSGYGINGRMYFNKGSHGFDNVLMDMKTIFRIVGPDFKKKRLAKPFNSIHIYPFMYGELIKTAKAKQCPSPTSEANFPESPRPIPG